jgi:hypothetical protein
MTEINSHSGNLSNYRQTKHEKNKQKINFYNTCPCPIHIWAIMVQVSVVSMELSVEDTFKNELYKKYESLKKVLIPKPEYFLLTKQRQTSSKKM